MMRAMRIAILSTYPPRACGIGTFAFDVRTALLDVAERGRRRSARGRRRAAGSAAARDPSRRFARHARRLRSRRPDAQPHRRRRRPAPARVRDLRRSRRRVRALVRARAGSAARRDPAHGPVGADRAPARGADRALRRGRARDRAHGDGAEAPHRARRLRRREDPGRPARRAGRARSAASRAGGRSAASVRRSRSRRLRAHQVALPALHLRPDLAG